MKNLKDYLNESILDSIKPTLNNKLWNSLKLKKSAKIFIMKKIETWLSQYTNKKIKHAFIIGSMAGFQYNNDSDIDVNIVVELPESKSIEVRKFLPNGQNLPGTNHPVNYFLETKIKNEWVNNPSYDIINDKWIKKPKKEDDQQPIIKNFKAVIEISRFFISGINASIFEYKTDVHAYETYKDYLKHSDEEDKNDLKKMMNLKLQEIIADIDSILIAKHMIVALRKEAFEKQSSEIKISSEIAFKSNNHSINNLIYKYIENLGYFDKLIKILKEKNKWISLLSND